jgi:hypothetical protein
MSERNFANYASVAAFSTSMCIVNAFHHHPYWAAFFGSAAVAGVLYAFREARSSVTTGIGPGFHELIPRTRRDISNPNLKL